MIFNSQLTILEVLVVVVSGWISTGFVGYLWRKDPQHSWLLYTMFVAGLLLSLAGSYLGWIAVIRVTEGLAGVPVWTSPITTVAVIVISALPTFFAVQFLRHSGKK